MNGPLLHLYGSEFIIPVEAEFIGNVSVMKTGGVPKLQKSLSRML